MKRISWKYIAAMALVVVISLTAVSCGNNASTPAKVNQGVIASWSFSLDASSVNLTTKASGAMFAVKNTKDASDRKVVINAQVGIDPADWGGVSFNIPAGWEVGAVTSDHPLSCIILQTLSNEEKYQRVVEIGNTKNGGVTPDGIVNIVIELSPMPDNKNTEETVNVGIAVGSEGENIQGPVTGYFQVTFN
jgi:hypothetical protein